MTTKVTCTICKKQHESVTGVENNHQGDDCASEIFGDKLQGFYGSTHYDGDVFKFQNGRPDDIPEGTVCDSCITDLKNRGLITQIAEDVFGILHSS